MKCGSVSCTTRPRSRRERFNCTILLRKSSTSGGAAGLAGLHRACPPPSAGAHASARAPTCACACVRERCGCFPCFECTLRARVAPMLVSISLIGSVLPAASLRVERLSSEIRERRCRLHRLFLWFLRRSHRIETRCFYRLCADSGPPIFAATPGFAPFKPRLQPQPQPFDLGRGPSLSAGSFSPTSPSGGLSNPITCAPICTAVLVSRHTCCCAAGRRHTCTAVLVGWHTCTAAGRRHTHCCAGQPGK